MSIYNQVNAIDCCNSDGDDHSDEVTLQENNINDRYRECGEEETPEETYIYFELPIIKE